VVDLDVERLTVNLNSTEAEVRAAAEYVTTMEGARARGAVYLSHELNNLEHFVAQEAATGEHDKVSKRA
jgi:hypothetical protein